MAKCGLTLTTFVANVEGRVVGGNVTDNELDLLTLLPEPNRLDGSSLAQELNHLDAVSTHTVLKGRT